MEHQGTGLPGSSSEVSTGERWILIYELNISGVSRVSKIFEQNQDVCVIGQVILIILLLLLFIYHLFIQLMEWPIARGINGDEKVDIQILAHNRYKHQIKWKIRFVITGF